MSALTPATILVRARDVVVRLGDAENVYVMVGDDRLASTPHALPILHAFAQPRSVADVLAAVATGPESWIELSSTVLQLARAGILRPPGDLRARPEGFARPSIHVVMLDDEARTGNYLAALRDVVTEADVVLDIGTGTGVLAAGAARAGARHVYAVESSAIADAAQRVFAANALDGRITLVRGRSTEVTLPQQRADVLVTEIIGNDPLDERILEVVSDAKERLLVPSPRLIPSALEIFGVLVDVPGPLLERHVFTAERLAHWQALYGLDFSPLALVRPAATQPISVKTADFVRWPRVAAPVALREIDLVSPFERTFSVRHRVVLDSDVERLGLVLAFRATLAPGNVLSTLADDVTPSSSWRYGLWPALDRLRARAGETVDIDYSYARGTTSLTVT